MIDEKEKTALVICTPKVGQFWLNSFCEMSSVLHRTHSF